MFEQDAQQARCAPEGLRHCMAARVLCGMITLSKLCSESTEHGAHNHAALVAGSVTVLVHSCTIPHQTQQLIR